MIQFTYNSVVCRGYCLLMVSIPCAFVPDGDVDDGDEVVITDIDGEDGEVEEDGEEMRFRIL